MGIDYGLRLGVFWLRLSYPCHLQHNILGALYRSISPDLDCTSMDQRILLHASGPNGSLLATKSENLSIESPENGQCIRLPRHSVSILHLPLFQTLTSDSCFIIQVAGGVMTTGTDMSQSQLTTGLHLYTAGVALQLLVLLIFFALVFTFQFRIRREAPGTVSASRFLTAVLTSVMLLIVYRTVYRLIEFSAPKDSSLANTIKYNEWYMYVFDSLPMWVAAGLFSVFHPGRWLVGEKSEFQKKTRAQKREEKRIGKAEKAQKKEAIEIRMGERRTADDGSDIV